MSEMRSSADDRFLAQAKQALEQSVDQFDARLAAARHTGGIGR